MIFKKFGKLYFNVGVDVSKKLCYRCQNNNPELFYTFKDELNNRPITYCMNCVVLGRSDSVTPLYCMDVPKVKGDASYQLNFELSKIQSRASKDILESFKNRENLLVHAVTGAGKTELTFESICYAREHSHRVAFVAPRIDVVKEIYLRLQEAFKRLRIDLKYDGVKIELDHQCVVCTTHQLYNYIDHFDLIIVDETDAFPLIDDKFLFGAINRAATEQSSIILLTATPNLKMLKHIPITKTISIKRRYHGYDLATPKVYFCNTIKYLYKEKVHPKLLSTIAHSLNEKRRILIFVPEIKYIYVLKTLLKSHFDSVESVHSKDASRNEKVQLMRDEKVKILVTSTILERGVTFSYLDVIIIGAEKFNDNALIQMYGRVGRKIEDPTGNIYLFTSHQTLSIKKSIKHVRECNQS